MGDSNSKQMTVQTEQGEVVVHKMPLSDYALLLRALNNLPKKLGELMGSAQDLKNLSDTEMLVMLPGILAESWDDLVAIIAVPTDKDAAFMRELDGADALDVIDAILELNDFARIVNSVKKLLARRVQRVTPDLTPSDK